MWKDSRCELQEELQDPQSKTHLPFQLFAPALGLAHLLLLIPEFSGCQFESVGRSGWWLVQRCFEATVVWLLVLLMFLSVDWSKKIKICLSEKKGFVLKKKTLSYPHNSRHQRHIHVSRPDIPCVPAQLTTRQGVSATLCLQFSSACLCIGANRATLSVRSLRETFLNLSVAGASYCVKSLFLHRALEDGVPSEGTDTYSLVVTDIYTSMCIFHHYIPTDSTNRPTPDVESAIYVSICRIPG
jgi:hypothetical protein